MPAISEPARMRWRYDDYGPCDFIITNSPYTREVLHQLISHFEQIAPTWLLLAADWVSTLRRAVPAALF